MFLYKSTSFDDGITEAAVTFTVSAGADDDFSITLPDDSYTDDANNGNSEITGTGTVLPIKITIDTVAPRVVSITGNSQTVFNKDDLGR